MPRPVPRPQEPVSADALASLLSNRGIRDKAGYVAAWIRDRDLVREDMKRIVALLRPPATELREEIAAHEGEPNARLRRRMSQCSVLITTIVGATIWLGSGSRRLLKESMEAIRLAHDAADHRAEITALYNKGTILNMRGRLHEALNTYRAAVELGKRHGLMTTAFPSLIAGAGILHFKLNDHTEALKAVDECTTLLAQGGHTDDWVATTLELRGRIIYKLGRVEESLNMLTSAARFAADGGYSLIELRILIAIINILNDIAEYPSALEHTQRIELLIHNVTQPARRMEVLWTIARLLMKLNEPEAARAHLEEACRIAEERENFSQRSSATHLLGRLHLEQGDYVNAERWLQEALRLAESLNRQACIRSRILAQLGRAYTGQGRLPEAEEAYRAAIIPETETAPATDIVETECALGTLCEELGRMDDAAAHYSRAAAAGTVANRDEEIAFATERLALLAAGRSDFRAAFDYYRRHHELRRALDARHHDNRIMILRVRYRIDQLEAATAQERDEKERAHAALHSAHADIDAMKLALIEHQQRFSMLRSRLEELTRRTEEEGDAEALGLLRSITREAGGHAAITQAQWQMNLTNANEEFRKRLRERHPALTPALELLCDCIRSGLTTDSIASVLHITTAAISKRRHRLRKALSLRAGQTLEKYLAEM